MKNETDFEFNNRLANMDKACLASECYKLRKINQEINSNYNRLLSQRQKARDEILSHTKQHYDFSEMQESIKTKNNIIIKLCMFIAFLMALFFMNIASVIMGN
jgi:hypothetical protein